MFQVQSLQTVNGSAHFIDIKVLKIFTDADFLKNSFNKL